MPRSKFLSIAFTTLCLATSSTHAQTQRAVHALEPSGLPRYDHVRQTNELAKKLLRLDSIARQNYELFHPDTLPETKLSRPQATVSAFDWRQLNKVSEAHRQRTDDCWANAAIEALECSYLIRNNRRLTLSTQPVLDHLLMNATHVSGNSMAALEHLLKTGAAELAQYPYTGEPADPLKVPLPYRAIAWGYVQRADQPPTAAEVKEALLLRGPLVVSVFATPKFHVYQSGLYHEPEARPDRTAPTNHVVLLVGWDDARGPQGAWKIKNTWGVGWGEDGFMWIARGSNNICHSAVWVCAPSEFYPLSADFYKLVVGAKPLAPVPAGR